MHFLIEKLIEFSHILSKHGQRDDTRQPFINTLIFHMGVEESLASIMSGRSLLVSRSFYAGSNLFVKTITENMKTKYGLVIGERSAEEIIRNHGINSAETGLVEISGRDEQSGEKTCRQVPISEIATCLQTCAGSFALYLQQFIDDACDCLCEKIDLKQLVITSEEILPCGFDVLLERESGLPVIYTNDLILFVKTSG